MEKLKAIDLFCGCGGLSLGLSRAGFRIVAAIDNDPLAKSTFAKNHPQTLAILANVKAVDPWALMKRLDLGSGQLDLLAGCPPCQGFSTIRTLNGSRQIRDPMNDLVFEYIRFINVFRPRAVMIENVPGLVFDPRIAEVRSQLRKMGYQSIIDVLDAADFGVPQRRKRMILIAMANDAPEFAPPVAAKQTVQIAIGNLPNPSLTKDPAHNYTVVRQARVSELISRIPKDGGSRSELPLEFQLACHRKTNGFKDIYGRMSWSKPAPTITGGCINPSKGRFLHPEENRAVTLREAAMLQSFPRSYFFDLTSGRYPAAQMIGNAFPPKFAEHHGRKLRALLMAQR